MKAERLGQRDVTNRLIRRIVMLKQEEMPFLSVFLDMIKMCRRMEDVAEKSELKVQKNHFRPPLTFRAAFVFPRPALSCSDFSVMCGEGLLRRTCCVAERPFDRVVRADVHSSW